MSARAVAVVTGGTQGIGLAVARALAAEPIALVLAYRSDDAAADAALAALAGVPATVQAERCDVSDPAAVRRLFERADERGELTALVNCAGYAEEQASFEAISAERWARVLATNVIGTASCCREAVRRMKRGSGNRAIVNLSSRAAVLGSPGEYVDYAASKAAVDTLTRGLALEVAPWGIRVNSVRPGIIDTGFHAGAGDPGRAERLGPGQPLGRAGTPEDVAHAVTWLLSGQAGFTTGSIIDVSGGR